MALRVGGSRLDQASRRASPGHPEETTSSTIAGRPGRRWPRGLGCGRRRGRPAGSEGPDTRGEGMSVLDQFRLDGRVAIVTGGARGLGKAMAEALASAGAAVAVTARSQEA